MPLQTAEILRRTFVADVEHHVTLGSTNDLAKQYAADRRQPLPLLIVADEQTAGRGRAANRWWTGRGSLAFSLLLSATALGIPRSRSPLVALAAALAVVETAAPRLAGRTVGLHWPNDVYVEGRKLAGVLVELLADGHCVVGIGVNTNHSLDDAPPELQSSAATLSDLTGTHHDHTDFLIDVLARLDGLLHQIVNHPADIGRHADRMCLQRGQALTVAIAGRNVDGQCIGIGDDGCLLLDTTGGLRRIVSGVVRRGSQRETT
ncbi:MAG: biotin--[acetyl-CoA-carboxylase] ligase [Pirellulales bacterium]|nr:biotin--[acetyl-CoA-carboxylase] ligase [Pirellulales bacterium]